MFCITALAEDAVTRGHTLCTQCLESRSSAAAVGQTHSNLLSIREEEGEYNEEIVISCSHCGELGCIINQNWKWKRPCLIQMGASVGNIYLCTFCRPLSVCKQDRWVALFLEMRHARGRATKLTTSQVWLLVEACAQLVALAAAGYHGAFFFNAVTHWVM